MPVKQVQRIGLLARLAEGAKPLVGFVAAALLSIASALVGSRFTADFDGKANRPAAMLELLKEQSRLLEEAKARRAFQSGRPSATIESTRTRSSAG